MSYTCNQMYLLKFLRCQHSDNFSYYNYGYIVYQRDIPCTPSNLWYICIVIQLEYARAYDEFTKQIQLIEL